MSHISFSALKIFQECPHKYKINYIDGKKKALVDVAGKPIKFGEGNNANQIVGKVGKAALTTA